MVRLRESRDMTRREVFQTTDSLNNTADGFKDALDRTFEYWVLKSLRVIIHILMGKLEREGE